MDELFAAASRVRERAYAPYSCFAVGAALRASSGAVFLGCNVENVSYGLTTCAERAAVFSAVSAGDTAFDEMAIVADTDLPVVPCGACRQVMAEFNADLRITCWTVAGEKQEHRLSELLPKPRQGILHRPA